MKGPSDEPLVFKEQAHWNMALICKISRSNTSLVFPACARMDSNNGTQRRNCCIFTLEVQGSLIYKSRWIGAAPDLRAGLMENQMEVNLGVLDLRGE